MERSVAYGLRAKKARLQFIVDTGKHAVWLVSYECRNDAAVLDMNRVLRSGVVDWRLEKIRRRVRPFQDKRCVHASTVGHAGKVSKNADPNSERQGTAIF